MACALTLRDIVFHVPESESKALPRRILSIAALELPAGSLVGIKGASGSGKTSLLGVLSGLLRPHSGTVIWTEEQGRSVLLSAASEARRDRWRGERVGMVFQDFQLVDGLSALENVVLPLTFRAWVVPARSRERAANLLHEVGIERLDQRVERMSRGEKQRVAIARALLREPGLLLADEPTASLDEKNAGIITELLVNSAQALGCTLVVVSHEAAVLARMHRVLHLERGVLHECHIKESS